MTRLIPIERYRNIGILASPDAGRTTTIERILAAAGAAQPMDERDITLTSAATSCIWRGFRLNIVALPAADRPIDEEALAAIDGVVILLDAGEGITEELAAAVGQIEARRMPCLAFVNKLDRDAADLDGVVAELAALGPARPVLCQLPIGAGDGLKGLVDVVANRATLWSGAGFRPRGEQAAVPDELSDASGAARQAIVTAVNSAGGAADPIAGELRAVVRNGSVIPVFGGSAFRDRGIDGLLDAIVDYLPAPSDVALTVTGADGRPVARLASDDEPFTGVAFRTVNDPAAGRLTFLRVYSGVLPAGGRALNAGAMVPEQVKSIVRIHANHAENVPQARTGDIVALAGLTHTAKGDTLCDPSTPVLAGGFRPRTAA